MSLRQKLAIGGLAAITALAGYSWYKAYTSDRSPIYQEAIKNGQKAPEINAVDLRGSPIKLSDLEDRLVLLDFFSTTCGPCKELTPELVKLYGECQKDLEVVMVGTMNQEREALVNYASKLPFRVIQDTKNEIKNSYGVNGIPHLVLVEDGKVADQMTGYGPMCLRWLDKIKKKIKKEN